MLEKNRKRIEWEIHVLGMVGQKKYAREKPEENREGKYMFWV